MWWMYFNRPQRHECSPIKIRELTKYRYCHSQNYAAYDKIEYIIDLAECPVCNKQYEFNHRDDKVVNRVPYSEVKGLKGLL